MGAKSKLGNLDSDLRLSSHGLRGISPTQRLQYRVGRYFLHHARIFLFLGCLDKPLTKDLQYHISLGENEEKCGAAMGKSSRSCPRKSSKAKLCHFLEPVGPDPNTFSLAPILFIQLATTKTRVVHNGSRCKGKQLQLCCDLLRSPGLFHLWLQFSDHGFRDWAPLFLPILWNHLCQFLRFLYYWSNQWRLL
jgi:hypothetical protein